MRTQLPRGGRIINNGSVSAQVPRPHAVAYTATKHAVTGLTKSLALEGRAHDIACGQIDIGNAATDLATAVSQGALQPDGSRLAEPLMRADDVARAVVYMASLPLDANVLSLTVMATKMPLVGRG
jgi:NADP-dependent 3-hydroxy acid dehydrogenase YdfG